MVKKLYILRHGETEYNRLGMVQGSGIDASLNETGRSQAAAFFKHYQHLPVDKVYVSSLIRTKETVQGFIDKGLPYEALADLREISWGSQEGVPFTPDTTTRYQSITYRWQQGEVDAKIDNGESPLEVATRVGRAFQYIVSQPEEQVLICTHGRAMRVLFCWMLNYPLSQMDHFLHNNTGLYVAIYSGGLYRLEVVNDLSHLSTPQSEN